MAFGALATLRDDFNRANNTDLGANWGTDLWAGHEPSDILSNQLKGATNFESNYFKNFTGIDMDVYWSIIALPTAGDVRFWARLQNPTVPSTINGYSVEIGTNGGGYWIKANNSTTSAGGSFGGAGTFAAGDKIGLRIIGVGIQELWRYRAGAWTRISTWNDTSVAATTGYASVTTENGTGLVVDDLYAGIVPVYEAAVLVDSPIIYLPMKEASGKPKDVSGNGNHVFVWYDNSWADADTLPTFHQASPIASDPSDYSIRWNGDVFCEIDDTAQTRVGDVFTLEAWAKRTRTGASEYIVASDGNGTTNGAGAMYFDSSNYLTLSRYSIAEIVKSTITITDTNWHHLVATKNGATSKLYIDGVDRTGTVTNYTCYTAQGLFSIGGSVDNNSIMNGYIDEVCVYPTALSAARVLAHYQAGALSLDNCLPDADVTTTGWTNTPLFSKVNDVSDATVIQATAV